MDGYKQPKAYIATQGLYYFIQLDKILLKQCIITWGFNSWVESSGFSIYILLQNTRIFFWKAFVLQEIIPIWCEKIRLQTVVNNS